MRFGNLGQDTGGPAVDGVLPEITVTPPDYTWLWLLLAALAIWFLMSQHDEKPRRRVRHARAKLTRGIAGLSE